MLHKARRRFQFFNSPACAAVKQEQEDHEAIARGVHGTAQHQWQHS
jgi:hypothetical protein